MLLRKQITFRIWSKILLAVWVILFRPAIAQDDDLLSMLPAMLFAAGSVVTIDNGWFVHRGKAVWGNCQHNGWWRTNRASIVRKSAQVRPNRMENIPLLVGNMKTHGYPCFEHTPPLWHDRRRDAHDTACRTNNRISGPTLEFPWTRSSSGRACDGGFRYDLTKFDPWYFDRLAEMAAEASKAGAVFIVNLYNQHALLEINAHYVDFPWRPGNSVQFTGMPSGVPAATSFYQRRRDLHRLYIRKVLDVLRPYKGTVVSLGNEFTGSLSFMRFFIDTVQEWERQNKSDVTLSVGATKDVLDAILLDPARKDTADVIDLRYFWYLPNGRLNAPGGGRNVPGRYALGSDSAETSASQIYRQVVTYRLAYPDKAIIHHIEADREQTIAFLMAGGSVLVRKLQYATELPASYIAPPDSAIIAPVYKLINQQLSVNLPGMKPVSAVVQSDAMTLVMTESASSSGKYLVYSKRGGFTLRLRPGLSRAKRYSADTGRLLQTLNVSGSFFGFSPSDNRSSFFVLE